MSNAFNGPLADSLREFAALMQSTGGQHIGLISTVRRLDRYLARVYPRATTVTKEILLAWFDSFKHVCPTSQARYRSSTLQFCKFLRRRDPNTAMHEDVPPLRVQRIFRPYIFSSEEVTTLLLAARNLRAPRLDPLRPFSMELLVVLLYTAGLRIGEVVRLRIRDYDAREATLLIRETKFAKTRLVALSASAQRVLDTYLIHRRRLRLSCAPSDPLRCCPVNHVPSVGGAADGLTLLMRHCGLKPARGRQGPRVHDLRHSFAMERVLQWYREGRDVQVLLPRLVTYMGHRSLESTQHYLTLTPEVLRVASGRFETYAAGRPQRVQS